jgi:hypothetical protein
MCGAALAHPPIQAKAPLRDVTPATKAANGNGDDEKPGPSVENVHGPSFLGLAEDPKTEFHYLYEDEPARSYAGLIFVVILLAIVGGAGYWQWKHNGFPFNRMGASSTQQSASSSEVAPAQSQDQQTHIDKPMTGAGDTQPAQPSENKPPDTGKTSDFTPQGEQSQAASGATTPNTTNSSEQPSSAATPPEKRAEEAKATPPASVTPARPKKASRAPAPKPAPKTEAASLATKIAPDADLEAAGERYLYGSGGTPQNCAKAQSNLQTAATRGNSKAQTVLGTMYATGHCVGRDLPTAYRWFARALHQDPQNSRISADLQVLWRQMSPQERQLATTNAQ